MIADGFLIPPQTPHDWLVASITFFSYLFVMIKKVNNPKQKNPSALEWIANLMLTLLICNIMYEWFLIENRTIEYMYLPLALSVILLPEIVTYLLMEKEGKEYVIETFKTIVDSFLKKFGYEKSDKKD